MADKSAEKERLFNEWFTKSYDRLRGTLRRYGMLDEDNFHDTYLFVRRQVLVPGKDITDYDAYFIGCYKKAALVKIKRENRYAHPEDTTQRPSASLFTAAPAPHEVSTFTADDVTSAFYDGHCGLSFSVFMREVTNLSLIHILPFRKKAGAGSPF